jgi:anti-sigma regulatory factor (Ser/Thr protein kinase)
MGRGGGGGSRVGGGGSNVFSSSFRNLRNYSKFAQAAGNAVEAAGGSGEAYFAVLEMIQNASRFGKSPVDIRISKKGDYLTVKVTDRGKGFDLNKYRNVNITHGLDGGTHGRGVPAMMVAGKVTTSNRGGRFTITLKTKVRQETPDINDLLNKFGGGF